MGQHKALDCSLGRYGRPLVLKGEMSTCCIMSGCNISDSVAAPRNGGVETRRAGCEWLYV